MPSSLEIPTDSNAFDNFRNRNETELTHALKWAAWKWLWEVAGCRLIGFEVRLEGPFGRIADVVGLGPENRVFLVEVKSSRADLRRDDNNERTREKLVAKSKSLDRAVELTRHVLSEAGKSTEGQNRNNETSGNRSRVALAEADARTFVRKSESTKTRIDTLSVKFHDLAYLRCADYHYIMAPHRMVRTTELPDQWGLLDQRGEIVVEAPLKQVRRVTPHVLRAIARANTRDLMKACEVRVIRSQR
ncbi:MAG: hypothetical protein IH867_09345 [Chloroflexi bacterium]|nr:hypothetical protein [Chloroflexota bacterium]